MFFIYFHILYLFIPKFLSSFYLLDGAKEMDKILKNVDQELANSGGPYFLGKNIEKTLKHTL